MNILAGINSIKRGKIASCYIDFSTLSIAGVVSRPYLNLYLTEYVGEAQILLSSVSFSNVFPDLIFSGLRYIWRPFFFGGYDNGGTVSLLSEQNNTAIITNPSTQQSVFVGGNLPQTDNTNNAGAWNTSKFAYPLIIDGAIDFDCNVNDTIEVMDAMLDSATSPSPMGKLFLQFTEFPIQVYERIRVLDRPTV